jgi:prepilin-type N-terminal cleavage/methylation domain-containing protein
MFLFAQKKLSQSGFTLIEMLVYIAILTIVSGGALTLLFSLTDQINAGRAQRLVSSSAQTALERILTEVRSADSVDGLTSTLEVSPGVLVLERGASTTAVALSAGTVLLSSDSIVQGPLTSGDVSVDELRFYHYDNTNTEMVRVRLTLSATVGDTSITRTFNAAGVLRGSYD